MALGFKKQDTTRYSKLGKNRKSKTGWRKPKGRDSKMRLNMAGYPTSPTIGHRKAKNERGKINGLNHIIVSNLKDLDNLKEKDLITISGRVGAKKKLAMIKKAEELNLQLNNVKQNKENKK